MFYPLMYFRLGDAVTGVLSQADLLLLNHTHPAPMAGRKLLLHFALHPSSLGIASSTRD
jgi:hypothetical protein